MCQLCTQWLGGAMPPRLCSDVPLWQPAFNWNGTHAGCAGQCGYSGRRFLPLRPFGARLPIRASPYVPRRWGLGPPSVGKPRCRGCARFHAPAAAAALQAGPSPGRPTRPGPRPGFLWGRALPPGPQRSLFELKARNLHLRFDLAAILIPIMSGERSGCANLNSGLRVPTESQLEAL